ncbi:MAG: hypothetical protein WA628_00095 [Terriglobales bacterium]
MKIQTMITTAAVLLLLGQALAAQERPVSAMPKARELPAAEQRELTDMIAKKFHANLRGKLAVRGAGTYRFVAAEDFFVIDRKDLGSVAYETKAYGTANKPLEAKMFSQEALLPRVEEALRGAGIEVPDKQFARFQDEFVGTVHDRKALPEGFDPRKESMHVARTVAFTREVEGVPVFGSELLVGLNPDGTIGRLRLHWPKLNPEELKAARALQAAMKEKKWNVPKYFGEEGVEVLDVTAGVGHSAFADPRFKSAAVVRVLYRRTAKDTQYPIASTAYKYFDQAGKEVVFSSFPAGPATPAKLKREGKHESRQDSKPESKQ